MPLSISELWSLLLVLSVSSPAHGHATIQQVVYNGTTYPLQNGVREPIDNLPINILDPNVSCKVDVNLPSMEVVPVKVC